MQSLVSFRSRKIRRLQKPTSLPSNFRWPNASQKQFAKRCALSKHAVITYKGMLNKDFYAASDQKDLYIASKGHYVLLFVKASGYTCSLHPEVVHGKRGKCPKCGLDLIEIEAYK